MPFLLLAALVAANPPAIVKPEALGSFFSALEALEDGSAKENLDIVVFGNSLIAGDNVVNVVRSRLQKRFGDGGRGLLRAELIGLVGSHERVGVAPPRTFWPYNLAMGPPGRGHFGLSGVFHESKKATKTEWPMEGETKGELFWLDHKDAPVMALYAGEGLLHVITPDREQTRGRSLQFEIPAKTKKVTLKVLDAHAVVFGMSFDREKPGVILDNFGIPAAEAGKFLSANEETTMQQLTARNPKLAVFMLGGNEARRLGWSSVPAKVNKVRMRAQLEQLITRTVAASPEKPACLVVGPIDAVYRDEAKNPADRLKTHPHVYDIIKLEQEAASAAGCAFFDLFAAMGGTGSLAKFNAKGWLHDDLVHPKGRGLDVLGEMFAKALFDAYAHRQKTAAVATLR